MLRRSSGSLLLIVIITGITYTLFFVVPGDPAVQAVPKGASPQTIADVRRRMGLDLPVWRQYLNFFHGPDLIGNGHPVRRPQLAAEPRLLVPEPRARP